MRFYAMTSPDRLARVRGGGWRRRGGLRCGRCARLIPHSEVWGGGRERSETDGELSSKNTRYEIRSRFFFPPLAPC